LPGYLAVGLLVLATFFAYANAWPDELVHDDKFFAGTPRQAEWSDIPRFFTEDLWAAAGADSDLYRPVLLLLLAVESRTYDAWLAGYHLDNILLHLLVTLLVYGLLRQVQRTAAEPGQSSDLYPLLAALVFAVHPVHAEVVNSIFNRSELLVALAGAGGLWWFLHFLESRPAWSWFGLALCYLFALFSKESAVMIPAIAIALVLILYPGPWMGQIRKCLPALCLLLPLALYLFLRAHALAPAPAEGVENVSDIAQTMAPPAAEGVENVSDIAQTMAPPRAEGVENVSDIAQTMAPPRAEGVENVSDIAQTMAPPPAEGVENVSAIAQASTVAGVVKLSIPSRIFEAFAFWGQGLWLIAWPDPLLLFHEIPPITQKWVLLGLQLALLVTAFLRFRAKQYALLASLAFFYLALLPAIRTVGNGDMLAQLAERYLYFPSVGLAIVLASGFSYIGRRHSAWHAIIPALIVLSLLTPLTWNRNSDWTSEVRLFESEYRRGHQEPDTLRLLTAAYIRKGKPDQAAAICDTHPFEGMQLTKYANHCAVAYNHLGRNADAERAFLAATSTSTQPGIHGNLAQFYLRQGRREDAIRQFELSANAEKNPALRAYRNGEMLVFLYPDNRQRLLEARSYFSEAVRLQPRMAAAQVWLDRIDQVLGGPRP